jgi:hypothetical protein
MVKRRGCFVFPLPYKCFSRIYLKENKSELGRAGIKLATSSTCPDGRG